MDILRPVSDAEAEAAWQRFVRNHVTAGRLLEAAQCVGPPLTDAELAHLLECKSCDAAYETFLKD